MVDLVTRRYDRTNTELLVSELKTLSANARVLVSSEGGLFDYASDDIVSANLRAIHSNIPGDARVFGTLSRPDGQGQSPRQGSHAALLTRPIQEFTVLANKGDWQVAEHWERPTIIGFCLEKR